MKKELLENWLRMRIAQEVGLRPGQVDVEAPLINYLIGGFQSWTIVPDLEEMVRMQLPASVLYEQASIAGLAEYLSGVSARRRTNDGLPALAGTAG